jgi:hypothetical protein
MSTSPGSRRESLVVRKSLFTLVGASAVATLTSIALGLPARADTAPSPGIFSTQAVKAPAHHVGAAGSPASKRPISSPARPAAPVPHGFASWSQVFAMQAKLDAAATRIAAASGGNASIVTAPLKRELHVFWAGAVPASARAIARRVGVSATFQHAAFRQRALVAEAKRLAAAPGVVEASPKADGSGVNVVVAATAGSAAQLPPAVAASRFPLTVTTGRRPSAMFSRQADTPPFWGGSRYNSPVGGCSNGFALSVPNTANVFELSAGHCGDNNQNVTIPGQTSPTGTITNKQQCRDNMAIYYPAGVAGRVYTGAFNSSSSARVSASTSDFVGDLVVSSGATSGENFNIPVQAVDVFGSVNGIPCSTVGPLTQAGFSNRNCADAPGDSGGPVYSYASDGSVIGRGTVTSGIRGSGDCANSTLGSDVMWYAPLRRPAGDSQIGSLQNYGINLLGG